MLINKDYYEKTILYNFIFSAYCLLWIRRLYKNADSVLSFPDTVDSVHSVPTGTNTLAAIQAPNVFTVVQEFDATAGAKIGSAGVLITSDNDGAYYIHRCKRCKL